MIIMETPRHVEISITSRCNLNCKYCYHFDSDADVDDELPLHEWLLFFKELKKNSVLSVTIQGGEPFIRKDLKEILAGIVNNDMRFSILSNGTMLNDDIASYIASTKRCRFVQISIDGSAPEIHDKCRGEGSFSKSIKSIQILKKYKIPISVRVTINKLNVYDIENITKYLIKSINLKGFSINSASYLGRCKSPENNIQLSIEERSFVMKKLLDLNKKYNDCISASAGPLADVHQWTRMIREKNSNTITSKNSGKLCGCGGVLSKIAIRADGQITPCILLSHITLGRINSVDLKSIWLNNERLKFLRGIRNISLSDFAFCKDCEYIPWCTGNCPAISYSIIGKEAHPDPEACLKRFLQNGGRVPTIHETEY